MFRPCSIRLALLRSQFVLLFSRRIFLSLLNTSVIFIPWSFSFCVSFFLYLFLESFPFLPIHPFTFVLIIWLSSSTVSYSLSCSCFSALLALFCFLPYSSFIWMVLLCSSCSLLLSAFVFIHLQFLVSPVFLILFASSSFHLPAAFPLVVFSFSFCFLILLFSGRWLTCFFLHGERTTHRVWNGIYPGHKEDFLDWLRSYDTKGVCNLLWTKQGVHYSPCVHDPHAHLVTCGWARQGGVARMNLGEAKYGEVACSEAEDLSVKITPPQRDLLIFTDH